jgi:hypothetical protein
LGCVAVAGPLIAHLWHRPTYKRMPFTMLPFLQASMGATHARHRIQDWPILLLRCLIIVLLALLFARPLLKVTAEAPPLRRRHILALDDSLSMSYRDGADSYLDKMIKAAKTYVRNREEDTQYDICLLASRQWARNLERAEAMAFIHAIHPVSRQTDMQGFLADLGARQGRQPHNEQLSVFLASDFTKVVTRQLGACVQRLTVQALTRELIVPEKPVNNACVIQARVLNRSADTLSLAVTVANTGQSPQDRELVVQTDLSQEPFTPVPVQLAPDQQTVQLLNITLNEEREHDLRIGFSQEDKLGADDSFSLKVTLPKADITRILVVDGPQEEGFLFCAALQTLAKAASGRQLEIQRLTCAQLTEPSIEQAQVMVCAYALEELGVHTQSIKRFLKRGGRLLVFVAETQSPAVLKNWWQQGLLAARPQTLVKEWVYPRSEPDPPGESYLDAPALRALRNYRLDTLPLHSHFSCASHRDTQCLWPLQNGQGLIYARTVGQGTSLLINTSIGASLGDLTKSRAAPALAQCLIGRQQGLSAQAGKGNAPAHETHMMPPDIKQVDALLEAVFKVEPESTLQAGPGRASLKEHKPLWRYVAWALWGLLLAEPLLTSRTRQE